MKKKIALALSAGGARGIVHIGVIKELFKQNIIPDRISGVSMGALIGASIASGTKIEKIEEYFLNDNRKIYRYIVNPFNKLSIFSPSYLDKIISDLVRIKTFEEFLIPTSIGVTDFLSGRHIIFEKGEIHDILRASCSAAGIFPPYKIKDQIYFDGGYTDPISLSHLKHYSGKIIVVDANVQVTHENDSPILWNKNKKFNKVDLTLRSFDILIDFVKKQILNEYNFDYYWIAEMPEIRFLDFKKAEWIIKQGEILAREKIQQILSN